MLLFDDLILVFQPDLVKALHRAATTLLQNGAIIETMHSLGHQDLPYKRISKQSKESVFTSK
jgi:hypothetical protein